MRLALVASAVLLSQGACSTPSASIASPAAFEGQVVRACGYFDGTANLRSHRRDGSPGVGLGWTLQADRDDWICVTGTVTRVGCTEDTACSGWNHPYVLFRELHTE